MNNRRLPYLSVSTLILAIILMVVKGAQSQTSTIGQLPTNPNPSSTWWTVVDCAIPNTGCTSKSTLASVVTSVVGPLPIGIGYGGTGLSSFSSNQIIGTGASGALAQFAIPLPIAQGGTGLSSFSANQLLGTNNSGLGTQYALPLGVAYGGTGTAAPSIKTSGALTATGSWPSQTINLDVNAPLTASDALISCATCGVIGSFAIGQTVYAVATATTIIPGTNTIAFPLNQFGNGQYYVVGWAINCAGAASGTGALAIEPWMTYGATPNFATAAPNVAVTATPLQCPTASYNSCATALAAFPLPAPTTTPQQVWMWASFTQVPGGTIQGPCGVAIQLKQRPQNG